MATDPHTTSVRTGTLMVRKLRMFAKEFKDPVYSEAADILDMMLVREEGLVTEVHELSHELKKLREAISKNR
jgi:hypothetical protein